MCIKTIHKRSLAFLSLPSSLALFIFVVEWISGDLMTTAAMTTFFRHFQCGKKTILFAFLHEYIIQMVRVAGRQRRLD